MAFFLFVPLPRRWNATWRPLPGLCQWGRFHLTHLGRVPSLGQSLPPQCANGVPMGTVPFDTFRLWSAAASWFLRDAARSQSGRFTVKNVAASIAFGFDGTASTSAVFLMKTTSASSKSASESDFAHHPTALSRRFSSARSNAWSRAASRSPLSAAERQVVDVSNGTVPPNTRSRSYPAEAPPAAVHQAVDVSNGTVPS